MTSPDVLAPGNVFARDYTIVRRLSEGGMGAVYIVQQLSTGAQRALKLMHPQLVREPRLRQRFEQEARVGARIESEHVVQVLGAGIDEPSGMPWLVMELLSGQDLSHAIEQRGPLPPGEVREIFAQFTHAVAAAHRVGIVHRDLKPENIFLAVAHREGMTQLVKVLDFGIAKVVAEAKATATQALGTPIWMAPEQTEPGRAITPAADVWALGLIAFRMFTGKHFWISANSDEATSTMVLREAVIDPIVSASARAQVYGRAQLLPPGFDGWFARCVVREPQARFGDAGAAREAFTEMLERGSSAATTGPRTVAGAPVDYVQAGTPPGPYASAPYAPAPQVSGPAVFVAGALTQPGAPYVGAPPPPARSARSGSSPALVAGAAIAALVVVSAAGLGLRAWSRAQKVTACESGKGDDLLTACRTACDAEPKRLCVTHGDLLRTLGDKDSLAEAAHGYEKACDAEDWLGCRKLGSLQELGVEGAIEKSEPLALASYTKSCEGKNPSGCAWLGKQLERGRGIPRDLTKAASLFQSACDGGDPASCSLVGLRAENRPLPRPTAAELAPLYLKAAPALKKECDSGGLAECVMLGYLLQTGKGVEPDEAAAGALFHKACEGGSPDGCNNESALDLTGQDAGKSVSKAFESFQKLCKAGSLAACNNVGILQNNLPFTLRQEQGVSLFRLTCSDSVSLGCTRNGAVIPAPPGIPVDLKGARTLLTTTCSDGLGVACVNVGALSESGAGIEPNAVQAHWAYTKACASGAPDGCTAMSDGPFRPGEVWSGTYTCGQGVTDVALRILDASASQQVKAIFDFDYGHGQVVGRFLTSGTHDAARSTMAFAPGMWLEQPPGWKTVGFNGQVSLQKTSFVGKMEDAMCAGIRLVRRDSDMVAPLCAKDESFVEGHGCVPVPRVGGTALGAWTGKGTEASGASWLINATFTSLESGRCGQVSYPSLGCSGDWYCLKSSDGKKLRAREIITSAPGRCDSTGFVEMTLADDGQAAEWRWSSPVRTGGSTARLARTGAAP